MESATIVISMVIEPMNTKINLNLRANVTNTRNIGREPSKCKTKILNPTKQIVKAIFGWDYNTWCRCHYYGEFGHIRINCIKHHLRKRDTTKR